MAIVFAHEEVRRLKVAVVGCGNHAYRSIFPCFDYLAAEVVAVCDLDLARAQKYAKHFGAGQACASLKEVIARGEAEAVVLAVGPKQHPDLAAEALDAGLHVWLEKPPSADVAGVEKMIAARDRSGKQVVVGFKKAFMPATRRMMEALATGHYGKLRTVSGRFPLGFPEDGPKVLAEGRGTNWLGNGVHPLSFFVHVAGRPDALTVHRAKNGGAFIVMEFPSGAMGCLHDAAGATAASSMERYELVCEKGHMLCENNTRLTLFRPGAPFDYGRGHDYTLGSDEAAAVTYDIQHTLSTLYNKAIFVQGFVQELEHFVACALENVPPKIGTLEEAKAVMECYEAALLSEGKPVRLDDVKALRA
ncbi:MAG: Gfo/Idh/MocA family oxidoreductase [Planctomycetota bacterium]|nr:Gfo/Idh/MocA family oxidoreductase [Planctomycetota bacterium]